MVMLRAHDIYVLVACISGAARVGVVGSGGRQRGAGCLRRVVRVCINIGSGVGYKLTEAVGGAPHKVRSSMFLEMMGSFSFAPSARVSQPRRGATRAYLDGCCSSKVVWDGTEPN